MLPRCSLGLTVVAALGAGVLPAQATSIRVVIDNLAYSPPNVAAKVGDIVIWTNRDAVAHTATAAGAWDVQIAPGKSARLAMKKPGSFDYSCRFHPNMTGHITVAPK